MSSDTHTESHGHFSICRAASASEIRHPKCQIGCRLDDSNINLRFVCENRAFTMEFIMSSRNPYDARDGCHSTGHDGQMPSHAGPLRFPLMAQTVQVFACRSRL